VTINSQSRAISYSGQFWAMAHYSRFIRRGAHRFASTSPSDVSHVVFENPDGQRVLVLTNAGAARECRVRLGSEQIGIPLSGNSVTTLVW
jgi:glucosylceramidase